METLFLVCAIVGGTLIVCQLVLSLLGMGGHHDFGGHDVHDVGDHDVQHESSVTWFVGLLTFRTIVYALTIFGLAGLAAYRSWGEEPSTLLIALGAGVATLFVVGGIMKTLYRLRADGTVRVERAVGKKGTVYLTVPGQKAGVGKVLLNLQNRTVEYQAITSEGELPTGAKVVVVAVVSSDTVEVAPAATPERTTHV